MPGTTFVELFGRLTSELDSIFAVILGLMLIGFGVALILHARRRMAHGEREELEVFQASSRRTASL